MLEHFNDYISIAVLIALILLFVYFGLRSILNFVERGRIKREMEYLEKRKREN